MSPTTSRLRRKGGETWALADVTFEMREGEGVALLGASGSGKSTLLRAIAGVLEPDTGSLRTKGRVGSLLSVQAGVMALPTGRENTLLLGVLAGMTPQQARSEMEEVKRRSGLGEHYERLVASYSQACSRGWGWRSSRAPSRRSCCSTRSTRRSTTNLATTWRPTLMTSSRRAPSSWPRAATTRCCSRCAAARCCSSMAG